MTVELFSLCDHATVDSQGKISVMGIFDTIGAVKTPARHSHCAIALRLRLENSEAGDHKLRIVFIDEDGRPFAPPVEANLNVKPTAVSNTQTTNLVMNLNGIVFPKIGEFSLDLVVDGSIKARRPISVRQASVQAA